MILTVKTVLPSFGVNPFAEDKTSVYIITVLSVNDKMGDCAAYMGVCPDTSMWSVDERRNMEERVRLGGNKITEAEAKSLFPHIENKSLRYRS
jgi:hypothetical protein